MTPIPSRPAARLARCVALAAAAVPGGAALPAGAAPTLGVALACLAAAPAALAQEAVVVERIAFEGNRRFSEATLKYSMRTKEGQPLDRELLARDVSMLHEFFESISVQEEAAPGGIRLTFRVVENPLVSRVDYLGVTAYTLEELRPLVETRGGHPLARFRLDNDARVLERKYRDDGYHFVEVRTELLDDQDSKRVLVRVTEGPKVLVDDVLFEGNRAIPATRLRKELEMRPSGFLSPRPFVERRVEEDRLALLRLYRDESYLDARAWVQPVRFSADREDAVIVYGIEEGAPWSVGEVQVVGATSVPDRATAVAPAAALAPGASWKRRDIDRVVRRIEEECQRQGFPDCRVEVEPVPRPGEKAQDLRIVVQEGPRVRIRMLDVSGNVITRDKVILREFTVAPGDPFDAGAVRKGLQRVRDTQYFLDAGSVVHETDREDLRDLEIRVEENPRTSQFRVGVGLSSDEGVYGMLDLTLRNFDIADVPARWGDFFEGRAFKGAGQTLQLVLQPGSDVSRYRLSFEEPWVMDRPVLFGVDLYATESRLFRYDEDRAGVGLAFARRWLVPGRDMDDFYALTLRPRIERIEIDDVDEDAAPNVFDIEGSNDVRALHLEAAWRRQDQDVLTEQGWRATLGTELVGGALGGDFDVWKNTIEGVRTLTLWRDADDRAHTLRFRLGAGVATPIAGSGKVPIAERFFAGGAGGLGAIRGFEYSGIGPRGEGDPALGRGPVLASRRRNEGDPMGGEALATASVEYGVPLVADVLRGAVFVDAGTLSTNTGGLRRDWRSAAGFGVQIKVPFFGQVPLRFDFAFPIHKERGDERRVLSFEFSSFF